MADLKQIVMELESIWTFPAIQDASFNGLQVASHGSIDRIYGGVDSTLDFFQQAPYPENSLFIVHHGLFWSGANPVITGPMYEKIAFLIQHQSALYASHLPLDSHPEFGNNVGLLRLLHLPVDSMKPFGSEGAQTYGWQINSAEGWTLTEIYSRACHAISQNSLLLNYASERIHSVAVMSGSGDHFFQEAIEAGVDLFITGEFDHTMYLQARDYKKNVIMLGHYESEKIGIQSVGDYLSKKLSLEFTFLDVSPIFKKNTN